MIPFSKNASDYLAAGGIFSFDTFQRNLILFCINNELAKYVDFTTCVSLWPTLFAYLITSLMTKIPARKFQFPLILKFKPVLNHETF